MPNRTNGLRCSRCLEELQMFAAKNKVEYKEEMIDPSGTVDPAKLTDEIEDVPPSDSLESSSEDFAASPHTHRRVSSTETKSVETRHTRGTHQRSSLHRHRPNSPPQTVLSYRTTNCPFQDETSVAVEGSDERLGRRQRKKISHGELRTAGLSASPRTHG